MRYAERNNRRPDAHGDDKVERHGILYRVNLADCLHGDSTLLELLVVPLGHFAGCIQHTTMHLDIEIAQRSLILIGKRATDNQRVALISLVRIRRMSSSCPQHPVNCQRGFSAALASRASSWQRRR